MKNSQKKRLSEDEALAKRQAERDELVLRASEPKGQMNFIDMQGELKAFDERRQFIQNNVDDPEKKYDLYYHEVENMLKKIMSVKGVDQATRAAFKIVREEKCIFLTRGKMKNEKGIRGGDSRQALIEDLEEAATIIYENLMAGGDIPGLYNAFKNRNIDLGYYNVLNGPKSQALRADEKIRDVMNTIKAKTNKGL